MNGLGEGEETGLGIGRDMDMCMGRGEDSFARQASKCNRYIHIPMNPEPVKGRDLALA